MTSEKYDPLKDRELLKQLIGKAGGVSRLLGEKYRRDGHVNQGRLCDEIALTAYHMIDGDSMPKRWSMLEPDKFMQRYGDGSRWSRTKNYHLLIANGMPVFRVWTRTEVPFVWVDLSDVLAEEVRRLEDPPEVEPIHEGIIKKCKPHRFRAKVTEKKHIVAIATIAKALYGC